MEPVLARHEVAGLLFTMLPIGEPGGHGSWSRLLSDSGLREGFLREHSMNVAYADSKNILLVPERAQQRGRP